MAISLRQFDMPISPNEILQGTYGEWVLLILFCGLFIAVALATLPKHLILNETPKEIEPEIEHEMQDEQKESKLIKRKTIPLTKAEIRSIEDLEQILHEMINLIRQKGSTLDQHETAELSRALREISKKEEILKSGLDTMHKHVNAYKTMHRKDIHELNERLQKTKGKKQRRNIEEEIEYQQRMLKVLEFLNNHEQRIQQFAQDFNNALYTAMFKIKNRLERGSTLMF